MLSPRTLAAVCLVASLSGFTFASFSTADFAAHLDRQVHNIHCSFVPGLVDAGGGGSGCQVTMMSPYSSVLRDRLWGGIPISLPAMGVFALLAFLVCASWISGRLTERTCAALLVAFGAIPVAASLVMGALAAVKLGAACKLCIGIYVSSVAFWAAALGLWRQAAPDPSARPAPAQLWLGAAAASAVFVALPAAAYAYNAPDYRAFAEGCGTLATQGDDYGVLLALDAAGRGAEAVEVLDPLCPACRGFEDRLRASGLDARLSRRALLFPLDNECNWMIEDALHPGACVVSRAMLCADMARGGPSAREVLDWAFAEQESIREAASESRRGALARVRERFPTLASCVNSAKAKARLNKSLRWAVKNRLQVLTPQLFVAGRKLCDEDTDLGLEYTLSQLLERHAGGAR